MTTLGIFVAGIFVGAGLVVTGAFLSESFWDRD